MEQVLQGLYNIDLYLDDIGVFSKTLENHVKILDKILIQLEANGFTINPLKCEWANKLA